MDYIIDFYRGLDSINLLIFWGVIIVILLLLIFSIIMVNKNKDLKEIIAKEKKGNRENEYLRENIDDIPIADNHNDTVKEIEKPTIKKQEPIIEHGEKELEKSNETKFIAEEHVINFNNHNIVTPVQPVKNDIDIKEKPLISGQAYQKNVLREMSLNQTSPIGIVKREPQEKIEEKHATQNTLNNDNHINSFDESVKANNHNYLSEVSEKLRDAAQNNDIERTAYEIKQEAEAIISYEELMKKKDQIQIVDEEEAVISIEELLNKKSEKLYNITEKETDDKFIDELKSFREKL